MSVAMIPAPDERRWLLDELVTLGITAGTTWRDRPDLRHLLAPLADDDPDDDPAPPAPVRRGVNPGRAVFRIERRRTAATPASPRCSPSPSRRSSAPCFTFRY